MTEGYHMENLKRNTKADCLITSKVVGPYSCKEPNLAWSSLEACSSPESAERNVAPLTPWQKPSKILIPVTLCPDFKTP